MIPDKIPPMRWFGPSWGSQLNIDLNRMAVPEGCPCEHCGEAIEEGNQGIELDGIEPKAMFHLNCFLRQVIGSVAHQMRTCSCYVPGAHEGDPPELTLRQGANLAVELWAEKEKRGEHDDDEPRV